MYIHLIGGAFMITVDTHSFDPYFNLAVEEYFLKNSTEDVFMLWQNNCTAVIGRNQNVYAEINIPYAKEKGITVIRRITGGGAVYHDLGNVNYTFITSREKAGALNFAYFTAPIISALAQYGITAELSGRNDILANGFKFSGNAQHSTDTRILHHGTLLFDSDLTVMPSLLTVDPEKIKSKSIKSVRSRVTNLKPLFSKDIAVGEFMELIRAHVKDMYSTVHHEITADELQEIMLIREKYASPEWTFTPKGSYDNRSKKYFPFGLVDIYYSVRSAAIENISICGDFFGTKDTSLIENILKGVRHEERFIRERLADTDIGDYISGMNNDEFINMLFE